MRGWEVYMCIYIYISRDKFPAGIKNQMEHENEAAILGLGC